jgi:hypothetical protein
MESLRDVTIDGKALQEAWSFGHINSTVDCEGAPPNTEDTAKNLLSISNLNELLPVKIPGCKKWTDMLVSAEPDVLRMLTRVDSISPLVMLLDGYAFSRAISQLGPPGPANIDLTLMSKNPGWKEARRLFRIPVSEKDILLPAGRSRARSR